MALEPGSRLGPYEIVSPLGAGGMGEVYRARDTRLGREVAVKVLPEHLSDNPEIRQRFEREARAVSSLNHPHICALFDIGSQEGVDFLVMELLEGESLSLRLKKGPLPVAQALRIGIQIAGALEKAHKAGFAHRDLKPGNIMLTKSGAKLLDFGLARSLEQKVAGAGDSSDSVSSTPTLARQLTAAPTADSPLTTQGAILGTIQYMAPEQLDGREADRRTDIFALGLVLYEMVTGRRAFEADSQAGLIAEIMKGEPRSPSEISGATPPALDRVLQACLRKDPDERLQNAHDLRLQLEWIAEDPGEGPAEAAGAGSAMPGPRARRLPWIVAGVLAVVALAGWVSRHETVNELDRARRPVALTVELPSGPATGYNQSTRWPEFAISPDGRAVVLVAPDGEGVPHLWVRPMDRIELRRLEGTQEAEYPFWSPDGRTIGFFSQSKLMKVSAEGGPPQVLCDWDGGAGGTWSGDGVILFGGSPEGGGIMKVPAGGGVPEAVTAVRATPGGEGFTERARHEWPVFLPGGRHFLFLRFSGRSSDRALFMGALEGGEPRRILESGFKADFIAPDWLIYMQRSSLMAQRLDLDSLELLGEPVMIVDEIDQAVIPGMASFSASPRGHIGFVRSTATWDSQLIWYTRDGTAREQVTGRGSYVNVSLSPGGRIVSTAQGTGDSYDGAGVGEAPVDIWNIDLERGVTSRFTSRPSTSDENPVWSPDGKRLAYASHRDGVASVYVRDASGAGEETLLLASQRNPHPIDWSPDGRYLLLHASNVIGDSDLVYLDLKDPGAGPVDWVSGSGNQAQGQFSPDGRWVAYASYVGEVPEVFVRPFTSGEGKWQISGGGGDQPRWRDDGSELYYVAPGGTIMAVEIGAGPEFRASAPRVLFESPVMIPGFVFYGGQAAYDVAPGGQRFLINEDLSITQSRAAIEILLNWPRPGTR